MKPAIFKDTLLQEKFDRDGYVVFDFITDKDAQFISKEFYKLHKDIPVGFYSEAFNPDDDIRDDIFSATDLVFQPAIECVFKNYKKLGSTFLCKAPGETGKVGVHQDWTVVDESKYYSATIWVPTVDTTVENGALRILPGSHKFFDTYRGPNIPIIYRNHMNFLWDQMITVPMKAGQAFVLNHAVIHASAPNKSTQERLVIAYGITLQEAPLLFYYLNEEDKVEKFDMPDDFFQKYYNIGQRPLFGNLVETFEYPVAAITESDIKVLVKGKKSDTIFKSDILEMMPISTIDPHTITLKKEETKWVDNRTFIEKYSLRNIIIEIKKRLADHI